MQDAASTSTSTDHRTDLGATLEEAVSIRRLLERNTEELSGVITALGGGYVLPEAGGDLLRDGPGVLPTGAAL